MSRTIKNLVIVFTLICVIILVFFCIELIILNRDSGDEKTESPVLVNSPDENVDNDNGLEKTDTDPPVDTDPPEETDQNDENNPPEEQNQSHASKQYILPLLDDVHTIVLYADEELFDFTAELEHWTFTYKEDGNASLYIASDFITPPGGIGALAKSILTGYLEGGGSSVRGEQGIGNSTLRGVLVTGNKNGETYDAWINGPFGGGEIGHAVVFVANYQNEEQKAALYTILDTIELLETLDE